DRVAAGEDAGFLAIAFGPLAVALKRRLLAVGADLGGLLISGQCIDQRMFRRDHHVGRTVQGVRTCRINAQYIRWRRVIQRGVLAKDLPRLETFSSADEEIDFSATAAADPVL